MAWRKTARSATSKTMMIPFLIPAIGVNGSGGCKMFQMFGRCRFAFRTIDGPLFPVPKFHAEPGFAREASLLRNHSGSCGPFQVSDEWKEQEGRLSSHSRIAVECGMVSYSLAVGCGVTWC